MFECILFVRHFYFHSTLLLQFFFQVSNLRYIEVKEPYSYTQVALPQVPLLLFSYFHSGKGMAGTSPR